jgi:hypothetical protein
LSIWLSPVAVVAVDEALAVALVVIAALFPEKAAAQIQVRRVYFRAHLEQPTR